MKNNILLGAGACCLAAGWGAHAAEAVNDRPNIVLIYTDDQGYADLGIQGVDPDVRTPNLDQLARDGVLFTRGYTTAPQCIPSRAGLVSGRHQNAFGLDDNNGGPLTHNEYTVAERLRDAGYATGMVGKWHLEIGFDVNGQVYFSRDHLPDRHGFEEMFMGYMQDYHANYGLNGLDLRGEGYQVLHDPHFRVDIQTRAALAFLDRRKADERPFFLYLCWFAPHSPIEGPPQYMKRLAHVKDPIRREALASILAMDDGLGLIRAKLEAMGLTEKTLVFFISDNGAPLVEGNYIGSLNTPLVGEKGMLTDAGQRVPYIAAWPGTIPGGQVFDEMVSTLDASATAVALAKAPVDNRIEGRNLIPWLTGQKQGPVHDALYWRWRTQSAVLTPEWKFIRLGNERRYLFDATALGAERSEGNQIESLPEVAQSLEAKLTAKAATWAKPGLPEDVVAPDRRFFDMHVDGNLPFPPMEAGRTCAYIPWDPARPQTPPDAPAASWQAAAGGGSAVAGEILPEPRLQGWFVRQGRAEAAARGMKLVSTAPQLRTFLGRSFPADRRLVPPVAVTMVVRAERGSTMDMAWLPESGSRESDFQRSEAARMLVRGDGNWLEVSGTIESDEPISLLRIFLEGNGTTPVWILRIRLADGNGSVQEFEFQ